MSQATIVLRENLTFQLTTDQEYHKIYMSADGKDSITFVSVDDVNQTSSVVGIPFLRGVRLCPLKFPCALLVFKHVMSSYVIVWRSFINNYRFLSQNMIKKVVWSFIFCIAKPALLISKEWLFYINYCMIVSKQIMMSIIA